MTYVERAAKSVVTRYGRDPWAVADAIGLAVYEMPLPGKYRELYIGGKRQGGGRAIVLAPNLTAADARALLAHGLGHHFLHTGNRLHPGARRVGFIRSERQADDFAAYLLVPPLELTRRLSEIDAPDAYELADHFTVPLEVVARRVSLLAGDTGSLTPIT